MKKMMLLLSHIFGLIGLKNEQGTTTDIISIARSSDYEQEKFQRANRVAVSVLLCSGFCILLPNMCAGVGELLDVLMFQYTGPLVPLGLILCGFVNTFIYALKHKDIRHAIRVFGVRTVSVSRTESNAGLHFPPGVAGAGYMIQALRLQQLDGVHVMPRNLNQNRTSVTSDQITEWFI
uniref:Uncharacterized protein n=1 Tax=Plectus sambesii TaxID=2011161 RepID=A0A914WDN2_9BILA